MRTLLNTYAPRMMMSAWLLLHAARSRRSRGRSVAVLPSFLIANACAWSMISNFPVFSARGITVTVGSAFAPTSQPNRSQNPQYVH